MNRAGEKSSVGNSSRLCKKESVTNRKSRGEKITVRDRSNVGDDKLVFCRNRKDK